MNDANEYDLFGDNSQSYSLVDIMNEDNSDDNSINLFTYSPYYDDDKVIEVFNDGTQSMILLSLNCQSLHAKHDELQVYLEYYKNSNVTIDIICLQETWCQKALMRLSYPLKTII